MTSEDLRRRSGAGAHCVHNSRPSFVLRCSVLKIIQRSAVRLTHTHRGRQAGAGTRLTHRRLQEEPSAAQTPPMQRMDFLSFMSVSLAGASNMPINVLYTNRNRCSSVYHSSDYSHPAAPPRLHPHFSPMRFSGTLDFPFLTTHASRRRLQTQQRWLKRAGKAAQVIGHVSLA